MKTHWFVQSKLTNTTNKQTVKENSNYLLKHKFDVYHGFESNCRFF